MSCSTMVYYVRGGVNCRGGSTSSRRCARCRATRRRGPSSTRAAAVLSAVVMTSAVELVRRPAAATSVEGRRPRVLVAAGRSTHPQSVPPRTPVQAPAVCRKHVKTPRWIGMITLPDFRLHNLSWECFGLPSQGRRQV